MQFQSISAGSMLGMFFSFLVAVGLPIGLCIFVKIKTKAKLSSFFIGCLTFVVFALILEQILHTIIFTAIPNLAQNLIPYALYAGLAAAVFEEVGRFVSMKFFMKKNLNRENALMYGVGHGGIEAIILVGLTYISNLIVSFMINSGTMQTSLSMLDAATQQSTVEGLSTLWTTPSYLFFVPGVERIIAITLQLALSILVYKFVKEHKPGYFLLAIAIHFFVDFLTVILSNYIPMVALELILLVMVVIVGFFVFRLYQKDTENS